MDKYEGVCTKCGKHTLVWDVEFEPEGVDMIDVEQLCSACMEMLMNDL